MDEKDKKIEDQNKKIAHVLWIICISMVTAAITVFLATGSAGW